MLSKFVAKCNICINCFVFHKLLFLLNLISIVGMDFQKFLNFFQVVGRSISGDDKFLLNTQKIRFYVAEKLSGFIMKLLKKDSKKI